ncbi:MULTISPECIES: hypothetical protein [Nitrosomonas]|uniref:Uncharacterized protein n=1 Tax=Nitrosomonas communis TaxID=44574 RepID=A0A5D3Y9U4_9PROT|nr:MULTISPECIES: hypothetical protein [Nitrosomonas]TYP81863.1 hypothetical protein BCL69_10497 [Nitrosomonas communis]UVS62936.1 hypothetical protein NX761_07510 [Nitrosomonas sp. PLL12]
MKFRVIFPDAIDPIEPHAMRVDIEIGRRTKTLNQRERPGLGITLFESDLFDQKM